MIIVTGGAGFIGSCLQEALFRRGDSTVVVDRLRDRGKWRNLSAHPPTQLIAPEALPAFLNETERSRNGLQTTEKVQAVFHLGAISCTTATDGDQVWQANVALPQRLWRWCARERVPFIYASSAATYGDACTPDAFRDGLSGLDALRPLNLYGWSKQAFDLWVRDTLAKGEPAPPQWAGLKFFNVYGPNEYHKGAMSSIVKAKYDQARQGEPLTLFSSVVPEIPDGHQRRDFIWVGDTVRVMLWLLDNPRVSGLFNCGSGTARTYVDIAHLVGKASKRAYDIAFVSTPENIRSQYQSYTCADVSALRAAGYDAPFTSLEEGVTEYVEKYLMNGPRPL